MHERARQQVDSGSRDEEPDRRHGAYHRDFQKSERQLLRDLRQEQRGEANRDLFQSGHRRHREGKHPVAIGVKLASRVWFEEMTRVRIALVAAFVASLLAAALPAALCVFELRHLQESITKIDEAAARVKQTRDVVDKIGQTLVGFTAIALDLSDQERSN